MDASWVGRRVEKTNFTALGTSDIPSVEEIMFTKTMLYIADSTVAFGSGNLVSDTVMGVDMSVNTGIIPKFTANGELFFELHQFTKPEILLSLTYEHNATAVAEKDAWRDGSIRKIRLLVEGSAFATAGTNYANKTLLIDIAGKYENFDALSAEDGNDLVTCTFRGRYSIADDLFAEITVVNDLAALP
jgi:hypothetical protein